MATAHIESVVSVICENWNWCFPKYVIWYCLQIFGVCFATYTRTASFRLNSFPNLELSIPIHWVWLAVISAGVACGADDAHLFSKSLLDVGSCYFCPRTSDFVNVILFLFVSLHAFTVDIQTDILVSVVLCCNRQHQHHRLQMLSHIGVWTGELNNLSLNSFNIEWGISINNTWRWFVNDNIHHLWALWWFIS